MDSVYEGEKKMIEERIDKLIKEYQEGIEDNCQIIENCRDTLIRKLNCGLDDYILSSANKILEKRKENEYFRTFIELLNYVKGEERK